MKIALIGYGKMGKLVHSLATARNHSIVCTIDSKNNLTNTSVAEADICIDFSSPLCVLENVKTLSLLGKSIVMGTTGWEEHFETIKTHVNNSQIGFLYAPNFSLGIALFLNLLEKAAHIMLPFKQYEAAGIEMHHSQKLDNPSGTAKAIEEKFRLHYPSFPIFSSVRVGNMPGTHSVIFDSCVDTITLTHTARNREGFAEGAIIAAEWLQGKRGMFTLDNVLKEKMCYEKI